ncbi:MAG TPA: serine hydrolase domain-containing protein [Myxococcales bacterium]|nr:serine hydrolase domain-containing protein [Myxococcales bacterium]
MRDAHPGGFVTRALTALGALCLHAFPVHAQALPTASPEEVGLSSARLGRLGEAMRAEVEAKRLPGAVVLVARKGRIAYFEAVGARDPASGAALSKDAIFRIYSMTKPFVSVAALMLAEEGRLTLTDPVSKFLPAFAKMQVSVARKDSSGKTSYELVPATSAPTVYDLLRHTSGLAYGFSTANPLVKEAYVKHGLYRPDSLLAYRNLSPAEEVAAIAASPLAHQPGTVWEYGLSADVLGRVVEVVSGKRLGEFLEARVFKPLQMGDSGFFVPKDRAGRLAVPFATDPSNGQPVNLIDVLSPAKNDGGGTDGVSTASDYFRFCQMLLRGGELDGVRLLSRSSVVLMMSDHLGPLLDAGPTPGETLLGMKGYTFGLGFAVRREDGLAPIPGRAGEVTWGGASGTYFWIDPQEELIAIVMTHVSAARIQYRKLFRQLVYAAIAD